MIFKKNFHCFSLLVLKPINILFVILNPPKTFQNQEHYYENFNKMFQGHFTNFHISDILLVISIKMLQLEILNFYLRTTSVRILLIISARQHFQNEIFNFFQKREHSLYLGLYEEVKRIEPSSSIVESVQPKTYIILGIHSFMYPFILSFIL